MKKRLLSFLFVFCFIFYSFGSASASSFDVDEPDRVWLQAMDYCEGIDPLKPNGEPNSFQVYTGNYTSWARYDLPFSTTVSEVDILVRLTNNSSSALVGCQIRNHQDQVANLSIMNLGSGVYRIYGKTSPIASGPYFDLRFNVLTPGTSVTVSSFRIFRSNSVGYSIPNSTVWYSWYSSDSDENEQSGWVSNIENLQPDPDNSYNFIFHHQLSFFINSWKSYDYVGVRFNLTGSIDSISCYSNSIPIPFEMSVVQTPDSPESFYKGSYYEYSEDGYGTITLEPSTNTNVGDSVYTVTLLLDLRELSRASSNTPTIQINGSYTEMGCLITENPYNASTPLLFTGYVEYSNNNPVSYWLKVLGLKVSTGFDILAAKLDLLIGNSADADEFQDTMESQGQELGDLAGELDSVEKPSIDDVQTDIDSVVGGIDIESNTSIFTTVLSNEIVFKMVALVLTLSFAGYALYGKR